MLEMSAFDDDEMVQKHLIAFPWLHCMAIVVKLEFGVTSNIDITICRYCHLNTCGKPVSSL